MFDEYKNWVNTSDLLRSQSKLWMFVSGFFIFLFPIVLIYFIINSIQISFESIMTLITIMIGFLVFLLLALDFFKRSRENPNEELRIIRGKFEMIILKLEQIFSKQGISYTITSQYRLQKYKIPKGHEHIDYKLTSSKYNDKTIFLSIEQKEIDNSYEYYIRIKPTTNENEKFIKDMKYFVEKSFNLSSLELESKKFNLYLYTGIILMLIGVILPFFFIGNKYLIVTLVIGACILLPFGVILVRLYSIKIGRSIKYS